MQRRWPRRSRKVARESDHRFLYHLCMKFGKLPDDPFFEEMNPIVKLWLYESWINEIESEYEKLKQLGILIGSFYNPEAAKQMAKQDNADFTTTDEEFEESMRMVREHPLPQQQQTNKRRKRRRVIE